MNLFNPSDKNECETEKPCDINAVCSNSDGSFVCDCDSGFSGDGITCTGIELSW